MICLNLREPFFGLFSGPIMTEETSAIYLDYNATTPISPEAVDLMALAMKELWHNPSSGHRAGQRAKKAVDKARAQVAEMIGADKDREEITFVSGGTEVYLLIVTELVRKFACAVLLAAAGLASLPRSCVSARGDSRGRYAALRLTC